MKHLRLGVLCLAAVVTVSAHDTRGATPQSSATMDKAAMEAALWANEAKVNEAVEKHNLAAFKVLVADSAWSVDAGGKMSALDFQKNFAQVKIEPGWKITEPSVIWADTSTAILIYKWTGAGTMAGQPIPGVVFASTVWSHRGPKWVAVFHQESAAGAGK